MTEKLHRQIYRLSVSLNLFKGGLISGRTFNLVSKSKKMKKKDYPKHFQHRSILLNFRRMGKR